MAEQIRRVGLLKAVGATPALVAAVLLAEYVAVAFVAALAGLALGWRTAPLIVDPSAGLLGQPGTPPLAVSTIVLVTAVALGVAAAATFVPSVRAARTSTIRALADSARAPRRSAWIIALSARLPAPMLLGLRMVARRPRRVVLTTLSIAITVSGVVAALAAHLDVAADQTDPTSPFDSSKADRLDQVLLVITLTLVALAAVGDSGMTAPLWELALVVLATVGAVATLTAIPATVGARRPVADVLRSELA
jgi:hypothetical protein